MEILQRKGQKVEMKKKCFLNGVCLDIFVETTHSLYLFKNQALSSGPVFPKCNFLLQNQIYGTRASEGHWTRNL